MASILNLYLVIHKTTEHILVVTHYETLKYKVCWSELVRIIYTTKLQLLYS